MKEVDEAFAVAYLSALIDGEGCVAFYERPGTATYHAATQRYIVIGMTDVEVIDFAERCFRALGVDCHRYQRARPHYKKKLFHIICAKPNYRNVCRLASVLRLQHKGKRDRLQAMVATFKVQRCSGCGCAYEERTVGCDACGSRHRYRTRINRRPHSAKGTAISHFRWKRKPVNGNKEFIA